MQNVINPDLIFNSSVKYRAIEVEYNMSIIDSHIFLAKLLDTFTPEQIRKFSHDEVRQKVK